MDSLHQYWITKAGLADALSTTTTSLADQAGNTYEPVIGALSMLQEANERACTIRAALRDQCAPGQFIPVEPGLGKCTFVDLGAHVREDASFLLRQRYLTRDRHDFHA